MPPRHLQKLADRLDRGVDRLIGQPDGRVVISPYRGFGRGREMFVRGRVLVEKTISQATGSEALWRSLLNTYRRFQSDEVAGAKVRATYRDAVVETVSDDEGHFQIRLEPQELAQHTLWHVVHHELPHSGATAQAQVTIPSEAAEFAIISDIDDTIVQTGATSLLTMVRTIIRNAAMRLPFEGVADLYRTLHRERNPIFYVSSSPWNLYDVLHDFMNLHGIPHGPMFLQDWGIDEETLILRSHTEHKLAQINLLLDYYPDLRFILVGDSGQHDPEIYLQVIQARAQRIAAVFIRDVTPDVRDQGVTRIAEEAQAKGVEMVYVRDSTHALEHARRLGLAT